MRVWKHLLHCVVHWSIERSTSNGPKEPFWTLRRRQSKAHLKSGVSSFSYRPVYCSNGCSKHYRDGFLPTSFPRLNPLCDWLVAISSSFIRCCLQAVRHRRKTSSQRNIHIWRQMFLGIFWPTYTYRNQILYHISQACLWTCGRGDVSTPSFGSHLNTISTRG